MSLLTLGLAGLYALVNSISRHYHRPYGLELFLNVLAVCVILSVAAGAVWDLARIFHIQIVIGG